MTPYNWKHFTKRITIDATTESIFRAWSTQDGLESWFLKLAQFTSPGEIIRERREFVQRGDRYKWLWFGYDESIFEEQHVLSSNGRDELEFGFSGGCIVKVTIHEREGETICSLEQTMPMDDETEQRYFFIECGKGWTFYMTNLKSILEGGIDLRNKNDQIHNLVNA